MNGADMDIVFYEGLAELQFRHEPSKQPLHIAFRIVEMRLQVTCCIYLSK